MTLPARPSVVDLHTDRRRFLAGVRKVTALVAPTYGPLPRVVGVASLTPTRRPELLDDGGLLARRLVRLDHPVEDMGAMFLRGLLWQQRERCGDGTTLVAILFDTLLTEGARLLTAGIEPNALRRELDNGATAVDRALSALALPVTSEAEAIAIAASIGGDEALAGAIGGTLWSLGSDATIEVRAHHSRNVRVDPIAGSYWPSAPLTRAPIDASSDRRAALFRPAVVLSDLEFADPAAIVTTLRLAHAAGAQGLLLVARSLSPEGIAVLNANSSATFPVIAVRTPGMAIQDQIAMLVELAVLTSARPLLSAAGDAAASICPDHVGLVRRAWVEAGHFGIIGPTGDAAPRLALLREQVDRRLVGSDQSSERERDYDERTRERIARLTGAAARIEIGASDGQTTEVRKELAERMVRSVRSALQNGVVSGGGRALRDCLTALDATWDKPDQTERRAAVRMLRSTLAAPSERIAHNLGLDSITIAGGDRHCVIDPRTGRPDTSGLAIALDPVRTIRSAIQLAVAGAGQALTIDTLLLRRSPEQATTPDGRPTR